MSEGRYYFIENQSKSWYDKESDFQLCAKHFFNE